MKHALETSTNNEQDNMLKAAYALNLCMVSLSQIVDYNNLDILRYEYDAILNNLNIENVIKDDALLAAFEKMLDVCHFFILHAKDKEILKKKQTIRLKGALSKAFGGNNVIAIIGSANPWAIAAGAVTMIGVAAVNYKTQKMQAQLENEIEEWELEKSALEQLHNLRRQLFETAWKLEERFNFPDEYRLTEKQIKIYNDIINDSDPQNRYERLYLIQDYFKAYPLFWYYLGRAAMETAELYRIVSPGDRLRAFDAKGIGSDSQIYMHYLSEAKKAYGMFRETHNGNELMREDLISASVYLDHAQLCGESESDAILDDILHAKKLAPTDVEVMQTCAFRFLQLHTFYIEKKNAEKAVKCEKEAVFCLKFLLNRDYNPELNGKILSKLFIDSQNAQSFLQYRILKACIGRKAPFVYNQMLPWDDEMFNIDWTKYVNGTGIMRSAYNFFYGYIWLENADLFTAFNSAKSTNSYEFIKEVKTAFEKEKKEIDSNARDKCENHQQNIINSTLFNAMYARKEFVPSLLKEIIKSNTLLVSESDDGKIDRGPKLNNAIEAFFSSAIERDWRKLWIGTRTVNFNEYMFSKLEKDLLSFLDLRVKELVQQYVEKYKSKYGEVQGDYRSIIGNGGENESEAIKTILFIEHESERLRLEIQNRLSSGKRFWYPDPKYKESEMLLELYKTENDMMEKRLIRFNACLSSKTCMNETKENAKSLPNDGRLDEFSKYV